MMTRVLEIAETQIMLRLGQARIIALATVDEPEPAHAVGAALVRGGLPCLELARPRVGVLRAARRVDGLLVGAGNLRIGFEGGTSINRKDWGLTWNAALETGGVLVSEKIKLEFDISAIQNTVEA